MRQIMGQNQTRQLLQQSTGDFFLCQKVKTSESETSKGEETESSEVEEQQTGKMQMHQQVQSKMYRKVHRNDIKKKRKIVRNLQLGRSYGFYAWGAEEDAAQGQSDESRSGSADGSRGGSFKSRILIRFLSKVSYILSKDTKPDYSSIWNVIGFKKEWAVCAGILYKSFYSNVIAYCEQGFGRLQSKVFVIQSLFLH